MAVRASVAVALAASASACADDLGYQRSSIVGGEPELAASAVVALTTGSPTCGEHRVVSCTGLLVSPTAVLTAAHCVHRNVPSELEVLVGDDVRMGARVASNVHDIYVHPQWDAIENPLESDIAIVALTQPILQAAPLPLWELTLDEGLQGQSVRLIGFGKDEQGAVGVKREGVATIEAVDTATFRVIPSPGLSCKGDSGGPALLGDGDNEYSIGVASYGDPDCSASATYSRIDIHVASFIEPVLALIDERDTDSAHPEIDPADDDCDEQVGSDLGGCSVGAGGGSTVPSLPLLVVTVLLMRRRSPDSI